MGSFINVSAYGFDDPLRIAYIKTNNTQITSGLTRGISTVELNLINCTLSNKQSFDTYNSSSYSDAFVAYVGGLHSGTVLVGTTVDEPQSKLTTNATSVLLSIGVNVTALQYRGKFAFVALIGQPQQTIWKMGPRNSSNVVINAVVEGASLSNVYV
jgi:Interleukin-like EMT inducer